MVKQYPFLEGGERIDILNVGRAAGRRINDLLISAALNSTRGSISGVMMNPGSANRRIPVYQVQQFNFICAQFAEERRGERVFLTQNNQIAALPLETHSALIKGIHQTNECHIRFLLRFLRFAGKAYRKRQFTGVVSDSYFSRIGILVEGI